MSDDPPSHWDSSVERSPYENLRALMRALDIETPTSEILGLAFEHIAGLGDSDGHIVDRIREEFAEEQALARAERWLATQEEPPTITVPDARTIPEDTGSVVANETVRATVEYRLDARSSRACLEHDPDSVIGCAGPDEPGYCCPTCSQQRRREDAIIDALLAVWNDETPPRILDNNDTIDADDGESPPDTESATAGTVSSEADSETETTATAESSEMSRVTTDTIDETVSADQTTAATDAQTDRTHAMEQTGLDAFAERNRGGNA